MYRQINSLKYTENRCFVQKRFLEIFRIAWDETPENMQSKVATAGYFNLDFDRDDFE